jgi:hypothetical protein
MGGDGVRAFIVRLENRPGTLADLGEALGERGINISGLAGTSWDGDGAIAVITNDDSGARSLLDRRGDTYRECDVISIGLDDKPGTLGKVARLLADRGVNVEFLMPTGMQGTRITIAFGIDDATAARDAFGELAATGAQPI